MRYGYCDIKLKRYLSKLFHARHSLSTRTLPTSTYGYPAFFVSLWIKCFTVKCLWHRDSKFLYRVLTHSVCFYKSLVWLGVILSSTKTLMHVLLLRLNVKIHFLLAKRFLNLIENINLFPTSHERHKMASLW